MKYQLENIPVWRAYEADADCPLCFLEAEVEPQYITFFLGNSVMVPEMRVAVNQTGFCGRHLGLLLRDGENKLGLSLMLETHLEQLVPRVDRALASASIPGRDRRIGGRGSARRAGGVGAEYVAEQLDRCLLCERLDRTLGNFAYTIVTLYGKDEAFRGKFRASRGFCLRHLSRVLAVSASELPRSSATEWYEDLRRLQREAAEAIRAALRSFAEAFDYRNRSGVDETARMSLPKAVSFLGGPAGDR